jgi:hypothetical protein
MQICAGNRVGLGRSVKEFPTGWIIAITFLIDGITALDSEIAGFSEECAEVR